MKLTITSTGGTLSFDATKRETSIGRESTCEWAIPSDKLSRVHAVFYNLTDRYAILDPGSKNGVVVDGLRIEPNKLVPVTNTSIIVLANQFYLTIGTVNKVETIDLPKTSTPAYKAQARRGKKSDDDYDDEVEKSSGTIGNVVKKVVLVCLAFMALLTVAIFILMYK